MNGTVSKNETGTSYLTKTVMVKLRKYYTFELFLPYRQTKAEGSKEAMRASKSEGSVS